MWDVKIENRGLQEEKNLSLLGTLKYCKLNLRWVAKRTGKFPHEYTQVTKKNTSKKVYPVFHWLIIQLALTWVGWPNREKLTSTCVQI